MPYGIPGFTRVWGDTLDEGNSETILANLVARARAIHGERLTSGERIEETVLALSGGGADGAFGAGLLAGWTERGDRPTFSVVTGVSTGSIIALLAFLGPDYDDEMRDFYTGYSTEDILEPAPLAAITGASAISDVSGYRALIDQFIDDAVVERIKEESEKGRFLLIGTTNLDAARPVIWNLSAIARSGHPMAKQLIRDIVQASSAVPAVMPPVVIPVTGPDGAEHDEVHVDGGATQQVMIFSPELPLKRVDDALGTSIDRTLYVVINNSIEKPYSPVELGVLSIAEKAVSGLITGSGSGDLYKIYAVTERDNVDFNVVWIPRDFDVEAQELFDPAYMQALYDLGYSYGLSGDEWRKVPPGFVTGDE